VAGVLRVVILARGLHVNLCASAPRGLYRMVSRLPTLGLWVVACA
jgi:type IV secretory pathway protease TraF